ncbi:peptidase M16 [Taibaiella sp. KBW10]|uniref:M16 family metallopeptidase n=1 Tax=Taibaiella sp. KBW10 TaxID=2153357 RepID=UPI000F598404|nr:insulinase family protein [Taibaiella sp. KBW10]RQO30270.1 peptidase M16 [Taibaiella sp. KBW10]
MIKKTIKIGLLSIGLCSAVLPASRLNAQQTLSEQLGIDAKVSTGTLPNGLKYYIRPNQKPENKVELRLIINAGSILEDEDQLGLAHFTEHMLFNGTKHFPKNELVNYLQSIGVEFGADLNAYTSFDETVYMLPVPTDNPKNIETGFQILQDWAQGALMTDKDVNEERKVVLEESRLGKGAQDRMQKKFLPKLLGDTRYGYRLPIGKDQLLKTFKPDVLRRFYKEWYRPNLMAVVVVGDITAAKAEEMVVKYFSSLTNPASGKERKVFEANPYKKQEAMFLTDAEQTNTVMFLNFSPRKTEADKTVAEYRNTLTEQLAFAALNQRYQDLSSSATPPFIFAQADNSSYIRGYQSLGTALMPSTDLTTAINAAIGELLSVQEYGFTEAELEVVKKALLSTVEKSYNERNTTNSSAFLEEYQRNFLENEAIPGVEKEFDLYKALLPGIKAEEVTEAFKKLFTKEDRQKFFAAVMSPQTKDAKVNTDASLLAAINTAFKQKVTQKKEEIVSDQLLDQMPEMGTITNTVKDEQLNTVTYTLSNGVLVTVKNTDFKSDEVLLKGVKKGGTGNYGAADKLTVSLMPQLVETMGYGKYTPTALSKALAGKNVEAAPEMGEVSNGISGKSDAKHVETLLQLVHLELTQPRVDAELLKAFVGKMNMQLKFVKSNPQMSFVDTLLKVVYNNNPLSPVAFPSEAQLNALDAQHIGDIYKKEFSAANGYHFFIVGNVDPEQLKPLLARYLGSIKTGSGAPSFKDNGLRMKAGNNKFVYEKGKDAKSMIFAQYFGEMPFSEDMALKATLIGDILTIRVIEKLREEMGSIYSGGFSGTFSRDPYPNYVLGTQLPTGPENVDAILKATDVEIAKLKKDGPEQKDLDKVKIAIVEKRKENLKTNMYWLNKLEQLKFEEYSKDRFLTFDKALEGINVKDIKEAANKFFDGKNSFIGIMNPEKKK